MVIKPSVDGRLGSLRAQTGATGAAPSAKTTATAVPSEAKATASKNDVATAIDASAIDTAAPVQADAFDTAAKAVKQGLALGDAIGVAGAHVKTNARPAPTEPTTSRTGTSYKEVENAKVFVKGAGETHAANPSDISQGAANDCWFLSSLATIAKNKPELLEKNITSNNDGTYSVTLYPPASLETGIAGSIDGLFGLEKRTLQILVSPELPHTDEGGEVVFADATKEDGTPELWVGLYEKALAQYKGGYGELQPSNGTEGMALIAGAITEQNIASNLEFSQVAEWFKNGDGLTVVSMPADLAPEFEKYMDGTLQAEHVYYVSNVDEKAGTVEIRNPYGWNHEPICMPWDEFKYTLGWIDRGVLGS